jgi:hypothetical protein
MLTLGCTTEVVEAQTPWLTVGGGVAVPLGTQADLRERGFSLTAGVGRSAEAGWSLRADAEYLQLRAVAPQREMRGVGVSGTATLDFGTPTFRPYALAGLGAYRLQIADLPDNPYGITASVHTGIGVAVRLQARLALYAEARYVVHVTDYGLGGAGFFGSHGPVHAGIRWFF